MKTSSILKGKSPKSCNRYAVLSLTVFALVSMLLWPFWFSELLPGRFDVWLNLGLFHEYKNIVLGYLTGEASIYSNFPEGNIYKYGEPTFLNGFLFWLIKMLLSSDQKAMIALYDLTLSLNWISLSILISKISRTSLFSGFLASSFFVLSGFHLGLLDNISYLVFYPTFFASAILVNSKTPNTSSIILASVLVAAQMYFSVYGFAMSLFCLLALVASKTVTVSFKNAAWFALSTSILVLPMLVNYGLESQILITDREFFTPEVINSFAFNLSDVFTSHPTNWIYGSNTFQPEADDFHKIGNLGIVALLVATFGFWKSSGAMRVALGSLLVAGIVFSFGLHTQLMTALNVGYVRYICDFKLLFKFYHLVLLGLCMAVGIAFKHLAELSSGKVLIVGLTLLFALENLPTEITQNSSLYNEEILPTEVTDFLSEQNGVALILPAYLPPIEDRTNECSISDGRLQEYKLFYLAEKNKVKMLNGSNAFVPKARQKVQEVLRISSPENGLSSLHAEKPFDYLILNGSSAFNACSPQLTASEMTENIVLKTDSNWSVIKMQIN